MLILLNYPYFFKVFQASDKCKEKIILFENRRRFNIFNEGDKFVVKRRVNINKHSPDSKAAGKNDLV
jgi:hypothetical protein